MKSNTSTHRLITPFAIPRPSPKKMVILEMLKTKGPLYGLQMVDESSMLEDKTLWLKKGSIYVMLDRMEESGWIESWKENPRKHKHGTRRIYKIVALGERILESWHYAESKFLDREGLVV